MELALHSSAKQSSSAVQMCSLKAANIRPGRLCSVPSPCLSDDNSAGPLNAACDLSRGYSRNNDRYDSSWTTWEHVVHQTFTFCTCKPMS